MITVTETAKEKIMEVLSQEEKSSEYLRISVSGVGWGGPRYALALDESAQEEKDIVEEANGIKVVYEKTISHYLDGKRIDFHNGPEGGFSISDNMPDKQCECEGGCC